MVDLFLLEALNEDEKELAAGHCCRSAVFCGYTAYAGSNGVIGSKAARHRDDDGLSGF